MRGEAGERGATTTIVSSDKDLMQLVTDKVTMFDTMKDRRIGIAEVIEKFGVPPEKVVEVQALAGDSTDNVPGVPGIGIKTAAQLIVEYGDLETLLKRAGEIKQPKRREALIENAEKARISRQLVLLDDKVKLDTAARRTRGARARCAQADRVFEGDGILHADPAGGGIFADRSVRCGGGCRQQERFTAVPRPRLSRLRERSVRRPVSPTVRAETPPPHPPPQAGEGAHQARATGRTRPIASRARRYRSPPRAPRRRGKLPFDRGKYQTIRSLEQLKAWIARVHDTGHFAIEAKSNSIDPMQAEISGIALALAPNDACYVPLGHKQSGGGAGLFDAGLAPDQIRASDALAVLKPLLESAGILKIGFNIKFNAVMLAQHGITIRNQDDAQLMSYALDAGRNAHGLEALAERWLGHAIVNYGELTGSGKNKLSFDQVAIDRAAEYSAERCRRHPAAMARAQAPPGRRAHDRGL